MYEVMLCSFVTTYVWNYIILFKIRYLCFIVCFMLNIVIVLTFLLMLTRWKEMKWTRSGIRYNKLLLLKPQYVWSSSIMRLIYARSHALYPHTMVINGLVNYWNIILTNFIIYFCMSLMVFFISTTWVMHYEFSTWII